MRVDVHTNYNVVSGGVYSPIFVIDLLCTLSYLGSVRSERIIICAEELVHYFLEANLATAFALMTFEC